MPHFALVSAPGANPRVWASDWKLFHGLLYMKTKGQVRPGRGLGVGGLWVCLPPPRRSFAPAPGLPSGGAAPVPATPLLLLCQSNLKQTPTAQPAQAEEAVKAQRFPYAALLRPGLLERGELARGMEKAVARVMSSVKVRQRVGRARA